MNPRPVKFEMVAKELLRWVSEEDPEDVRLWWRT